MDGCAVYFLLIFLHKKALELLQYRVGDVMMDVCIMSSFLSQISFLVLHLCHAPTAPNFSIVQYEYDFVSDFYP